MVHITFRPELGRGWEIVLTSEKKTMILIINILSLLLASIGLLVALLALGIALWQIRSARKIGKLEGDIIVLEAFLSVELAGRKDKELIQELLELIFNKAEKIGSEEIDEVKGILKDRYVDKGAL